MKLLKLPKHIVTFLWLTVFRQNVGVMCFAAVTNGTSIHPNLIVYFRGSPHPNIFHDFEDFFPMIEKISSEFSQISCGDETILMAVATRNKLLKTKNLSEGVYQNPLEVYLQNVKNFVRRNSPNFVDSLIELADKSNDIFPGTVKYLYAHHYFFDQDEFKKLRSFSETRKRFMDNVNSTNHTYKLGIMFSLKYCNIQMPKTNFTLWDPLQLVIFDSMVIYKDKDNVTVEELFIQLKTQFELCTMRAKRINSKVEVGLRTGLASGEEQNYFQVVTFWKLVNDWAIANNQKVIMYKAFDTYTTRDSPVGTLGFWKLAQTPRHYHIPADFIFMDKQLGNFSNISEPAFSAQRNHEVKELIEDVDFKHDNFVVVFDSLTISEYGSYHYYHHDDFLPLIRTIAVKFSSVCLLQQNPVETDAVAIHNNMTMQNKNKRNSHGLSQPLRLYQVFNFSKEHNLDNTLNSVKSANSLYPDTVKYLLFYDYDANKLFSYVTNAGEKILNQTVGFAISLPLLDCLRGTSVRSQVLRLLPYLKLIVIAFGTGQEDHDVGVEETVVGLTTAFVRCKKRIESMSQEQSPEFAFHLAWHDTDSRSIQNLSNLVSFWGRMNHWAKVTNTTVFMLQAFDDLTNKNKYTNGWWRLAFKPHTYHSIAEYVFEDKTERRSKISNGIPYQYPTSTTSLSVEVALQQQQLQQWKVTNSLFSSTNFIVQFSPITCDRRIKDSLNQDQARTIILELFTRFSLICSHGLFLEDLQNCYKHFPLEVAKHNMVQKNESQGLYLVFYLKSNWIRTLEVALDIANKANHISVESMQYLIASNYSVPSYLDDSRELINNLMDAKNLLRQASSRVLYKLGYIFPIVSCGHGTNLNKRIIPIIRILDLIIFDKQAEEADQEVGVYESIGGFTKQFEKCKQKILELNSSIEVAFRTSWSDTTKYHGHRPENLVLFWEKMNEWAISTNTKIFMLEAFDNPKTDNSKYSKLGWWRWLTKKTHNGSFIDIFEEKRAGVLANLKTENPVDGSSHPRTVLITVLTAIVIFALTAFSMFLFVYRRYKNKLAEALQYILTKKEEIEFLEGGHEQHSPQSRVIKLSDELIVAAQLRKYDKGFEVEQENFKFDETSPLGSGEFGKVCKGTVTKDEQEIDVAVKTLKKSSCEAVKNLLTEIKVMIHLGKHENIVSVIGANTEGLRRGNVLLFTELCGKGSLENYLRELRRRNKTAQNETEENVHIYQQQKVELEKPGMCQNLESRSDSIEKIVTYANGPHGMNQTQNLLSRWSYEIANGMEFIVSKKVVHADLATRNVLLTENLTAKISDFGLSRRLYNYTNYVKSKSQPLPWKWMSPESLRRSEFNEKTDVWAFGITLWEIYSLGDTPYPGLPWTANFASVLEGGLRLKEPEFNSNSIYNVMLRCWSIDPKNRPTFLQLKEILNRLKQ